MQQQNPQSGIYFITFTCFGWKPLFELTNAYDAIYKCFDYLVERKAAIIGYVIMPNHLHALLYLPPDAKSVILLLATLNDFWRMKSLSD